jgi:hypothetical protein
MIIESDIENKPTLSSAITDTNQFSIKNSAKAFYILSTSLYSDPILAILRELGCNARDSHVQAGQTKPWRLHLPSIVNPMLEIEDYGVGLDHESVMTMFTTFFESTKTSSNEFVGALGLGSKSPFSYTDNFTIVATKNGERNSYAAYKTDQGVPAIARLHTEKTDAENGVLIQIAVQQKDFNAFRERAAKAFRFFDQHPTCSTMSFQRSTSPFKLFGVDIGIEQDVGYGNYISYVLMGGIAYPINQDRTEFTPYRNLLQQRLIFKANIGDVEMTPSREGMTYNKQTVDWIVSQLEAITSKISDHLKTEFDKKTSDWAKAVFLLDAEYTTLTKLAAESIRKSYFASGYPKMEFEEADLKRLGLSVRYVSRNGNGNYIAGPSGQNTVIVNVSRNGMAKIVLDDQNTRVMDIREGGFGHNYFIFSSESKDLAKITAWLESKMHGEKVLLASEKIGKVETEKKAKTDFYKFVLKETGGYYSRRKVLATERCNGSLPSAAIYWIPIKNGKIDVPESLGFLEQTITMFVSQNHVKVIGFTASSKTPKGGRINVIEMIQNQLAAEISKAETDSGFNDLVLAELRGSYDFQHMAIPSMPKQYIQQLKDPKLASLIDLKYNSQLEKSGYHSIVVRKISREFYSELKKYTDHMTTYDSLMISGLAKFSHEDKVKLLNFVYELKTKV